jgi:rfaE bifunctional protein kinase chain/domain/rfaE bifunctional protein nucleotidyltransferase chain/domain
MSKRKIRQLDELAHILTSVREGKKVVHCHGVFDLMHIGHIRHFEAAKKLGDLLVVTLTPDRYVNKGPNRPVFTETLRAEAIAALDCVDYVAINNWPMAIETIRLVRPDFYAKGSDYRDADKDHTGGITLEQEAVESVGGELVFTDDITFSSSNLLNAHMATLPQEVGDYLSTFRTRYSTEEILKPLQSAKDLKVLVVGDTIIDEYQYCEAIGKSSKEPMLAVRHVSTEKFAGGILAVANHVANFAAEVSVVTMLGTENTQEEFLRSRMNPLVKQFYIHRKDSPTIVKRRFIEGYFFTKMMEVYEMSQGPLDPTDEELLCDTLEEQLPQYDVVIVVDFGHGMMSRKAINLVCEKAKFLAVNAQSNAGNLGYHTISTYPRADYVSIAENEMRLEARDRHGDLESMVLNVAQKMTCPRIVTTRGKNGCLCYSEANGFVQVPALANQVVDRMGAGDAYLSLTALCVAQDAPMEIVGFIGNAVGAHAVATVGHRQSVQRASLLKHIETLMK